MNFARVAQSAVVLACLALPCDAKFLEARQYITKESVERTLLSELSDMSLSAGLLTIKEDLRPMFTALPKNEQGTLEPSVVRYALHRFFVQKHGWYMAGLDPAGGAWNAPSPSSIMKDRAPAFIQSLFQQRMQGHGLGLHELAIFAAVLSELIHGEARNELHKVYSALRLPTSGSVPRLWSEAAVKAYLMQFIVGFELNMTGMEDFHFVEEKLVEIYPDWPSTYMWVADSRETHNLMMQSRRNPFIPHRETFEGSVAFVNDIWENFGSFQDLECKSLKARLVEMEHAGTGRVRLSRFYEGGLKGDWTLSESVEYMRNLGVLDETDPTRPSVVIANYMTSQTNCLSTSGFYSVCCSDECGGLLQHLERDLATPTATTKRIAELVSNLHSDTVHAPRNLSSPLLDRLDEIARLHSGQIPLHGRLFAQWMHHAYPRECPFPHVSGTVSPMSPDAWMAHRGTDSVEATVEEMQWHHSRKLDLSDEEEASLPWTQEEELVAESGHTSMTMTVRRVMALAALLSFALPMYHASRTMFGSEASKGDGVLV